MRLQDLGAVSVIRARRGAHARIRIVGEQLGQTRLNRTARLFRRRVRAVALSQPARQNLMSCLAAVALDRPRDVRKRRAHPTMRFRNEALL
jgi:hypothetical protein